MCFFFREKALIAFLAVRAVGDSLLCVAEHRCSLEVSSAVQQYELKREHIGGRVIAPIRNHRGLYIQPP